MVFFYFKILFLGSGDLRNAIFTSANMTEAYYKLNIHLNDECDSTVVRNILLAYIMLSDDFNPDSVRDIDYICDIWYLMRWIDSTKKRFVRDVNKLVSTLEKSVHIILDGQEAFNLVIPRVKKWLELLTSDVYNNIPIISKERLC